MQCRTKNRNIYIQIANAPILSPDFFSFLFHHLDEIKIYDYIRPLTKENYRKCLIRSRIFLKINCAEIMKLTIRYDSMIKYSYSAFGQFLATTSLPPHGDCCTVVKQQMSGVHSSRLQHQQDVMVWQSESIRKEGGGER